MRKKFTMLLASLFLGLGTLWAQPEVGKEYRIKEATQNLYLTITGYNQSNTGAKGSVPLLDKASANVDQVWTLEATGTDNVYNLKSKSGYYAVHTLWNVDAHDQTDNKAKVQFVSNGDTYKIKNINNGNQWWKSQNVDGKWYPFCDAGEGAAASWVLEEVPADEFATEVSLTITCNFNGGKVSEETVNAIPGSDLTIPVPDYTKITSCKIGETEQTVTDGVCTIVVPDATAAITVELETNLPFTVSTDYDNATWYAVQNRTTKYMSKTNDGVKVSNPTPTTEDALWAFMGDPFNGITVLNKAAGADFTLANDNGIKMKDGEAFVWNISKGNGGFMLREGDTGYNYIHNVGGGEGLGYWNDSQTTTDNGSAFVVTSEADMISLATAAKSNLSSKLDVYAEASYYTYSNEAVATAKAAVEAIATPENLLAALQAKAAVEAAQAGLTGQGTTGPVAGDIIMLKNRNYNKYLKANDADLTSVEGRNDLATLWVVEEGTVEGQVKLKNYSTEKYIGQIRQSETVPMEEAENAKEFAFTKQDDVYAVFKETSGGGYAYGHVAGHNVLVGWEASANASQWIVSNVRPLSITYLFNGTKLGESTEIVEVGSVYTVSSPYDFTAPSAVTVDETALGEGVLSFEVTKETATVTVEVAYNLPFEYAASVENIEHWYYMQMHSNNKKYIKRVENELTWNDATITDETEIPSYAWAFVGDPISGFKVVNKAAKEQEDNANYALSSTGNNADKVTLTEYANATLLFVKPSSENNVDFCLKPASGNYLNATDGTVKHWDDNDAGSTIKVSEVVSKHTLTLVQMFNDKEIADKIEQRVDEGSTYTFANPYAGNAFVTATCVANGTPVEEVDGRWKIQVVAGANEVVVTYAENLPFNTTTVTEGQFAVDTEWYVVKHKTAGDIWAYNSEATDNVEVKAMDYDIYNDAHLWCFVGNAIEGLKVYNKAAGASFSLDNSAPAKLVENNAAVWYVETSDQAFTESDVRLAFKRSEGDKNYANLQDGTLKGWGKDAGSTSCLISVKAELAAIAESKATLSALIAKATATKSLIVEAAATTLGTAIEAAEAIYNKEKAYKSEVEEQIAALTAAYDAARYITSLDNLRADVAYAVSTESRGAWYSQENQLNGTQKIEGVDYNPEDPNQQFAFLKSSATGNYYLYSVGQSKFVKASGGNTTLTENAEENMTFIEATGANKANYPWVIALNGGNNQVAVSNSYNPGIITSWNDTNDEGNMVRLEVAGALTLAQTIEAYELAAVKALLFAEITEATALVGANYIGDETKATLNAALVAAQAVYDNTEATYEGVNAEIATLAAAIEAAAYVTSVEGFSNNAIYTFLSKRSDVAYLMYDGENDFVASPFKDAALAENAGEANVNCQWAVYKSEEGNYYMYNLGAAKFMGTESAANTGIPFSATPMTTTMKFQVSAVNTHPIMISSNGGAGVVNQSNNAGFTNNNGVVNWNGGFGFTSDDGNVHKVKIVGTLAEEKLATIKEIVDKFEFETAVQELKDALAAANSTLAYMGEGLGFYSSTMEHPEIEIGEINDFKSDVENGTLEATIAEIKAKIKRLEDIMATFSINAPKAGGFYRFSHNFGTDEEPNVMYVQAVASGVSGKENAMVMTADQDAASIFYYTDSKLLSYSAGLYINEGSSRGLQYAGADVTFTAGEGYNVYKINVGNYLHANTTEVDGNNVYFVDHCGSDNCGVLHSFTIEEVTELPVTIGSTGYATFYTPVAVEVPAEVTASVITGIENGKVVLAQVTGVVPAGTGLILNAETADDYDFAIATSEVPAEFNEGLLKGTAAKTLITAEENTNYYVLANKDKGVGLYKAALNKDANGDKVTENGVAFHNGANKAYLPVVVAAEAPAMFSFGRGEGTTSIENAELATDNAELVIYDLTGRRVEKMVKGIYIVNGKKVLVK